MQFHVMTLFPEMIAQGLANSITGRALREKLISLNCVNIRDYSDNRHGKVDDYSYGGGAGMLIQAEPVYQCYQNLLSQIPDGHKKRVIYVTPQGRPFCQEIAEELVKNDDLIFLCGHYEGVDERVLEEIVTDYISIGDYVLTGGELPAMVMIDTIARLVDGVLGNDASAEIESFHGKLLEYPQFTRPEVWHDKAVPSVLLSGDAARIKSWRIKESIQRTRERREDLYRDYCRLVQLEEILLRHKREYADLLNLLELGYGEIVCWERNMILMRDRRDQASYFAHPTGDTFIRDIVTEDPVKEAESPVDFLKKQGLIREQDRPGIRRFIMHDTDDINEAKQLAKLLGLTEVRRTRLLVYTPRERPANARIRALREKLKDKVSPEMIAFIEEGITSGLMEGLRPVYYLDEEDPFPVGDLESFGIYAAKGPVLLLQ